MVGIKKQHSILNQCRITPEMCSSMTVLKFKHSYLISIKDPAVLDNFHIFPNTAVRTKLCLDSAEKLPGGKPQRLLEAHGELSGRTFEMTK